MQGAYITIQALIRWVLIKRTNETKILHKRTDNAQKGTLQGHGNRNNWYRKKTILQLLFKSCIWNENRNRSSSWPSAQGREEGGTYSRGLLVWHYDPKGCVLIWKRGANMCRCLNMEIWYPILLVLPFEIGLERLTIDLWSNLADRDENRHINKKLLQSHIPYMQKIY